MIEYVKLSNSKMNYFKVLNDKRTEFNVLNADFFKDYRCSNLIQQYFIRKRVLILKEKNKYTGYIWTDFNMSGEFQINSVYSLIPEEKYYNMLLKTLTRYSSIKYYCENNDFNSYILTNSGFKKTDGDIEMEYVFSQYLSEEKDNSIEYVPFKKGRDEKLRCFIQNEAFKNSSRIPLTVEDIYFDEMQKYYMSDAAVFIKAENTFIGYGQVIIERNVPLIVNVGILKTYRGNGYGKMLLLHLLHIMQCMSYKKVKIRVSYNNVVAMNLYSNIGFNIVSEKFIWEKTYSA